jgi:hypothetical protein
MIVIAKKSNVIGKTPVIEKMIKLKKIKIVTQEDLVKFIKGIEKILEYGEFLQFWNSEKQRLQLQIEMMENM